MTKRTSDLGYLEKLELLMKSALSAGAYGAHARLKKRYEEHLRREEK